MSRTYVVPAGYDVGCDSCGAYDTFDQESDAREWAENHTCEES